MIEAGSKNIVTRRVAEYVVASGDLPDKVLHEARRAFLNFLGCALGGSRHEVVATAERTLLRFAGPPQATVIARDRRSDALTACLLNCLSSSADTFDDTHAEAIVHPSGPVAAAALALSELKRVSGKDFLAAFALGVEIECRLSMAVSVPPARGNIGWSQTGIAGGVGAAVASARLLGLDAAGIVRALGIAASEAAGIRVMHGSMCTPFMPAHAAQTGLRAALLAEQGLSSAEAGIEGRHGFASSFAAEPHLPHLTDGLGERFEILRNTYKPYPCGIVIHPAIDGCLQLKAEHGFDGTAVERIRLEVAPVTLTLTDRRHPKDDFTAHVSLYHWVAAAALHGAAGLREGRLATIEEPPVVALRDRIDAVGDPALAPDAARIEVTLRDGRKLRSAVEHCIGSLGRPMTDRELEDKFRELAHESIAPPRIEPLIDACWRLGDLEDMGALARRAA